MYRRTFAALFLLLAIASGCCAPDVCSASRTRFSELQPIIDQLLLFEQKERRFPVNLEEAFPSGLPIGLAKLNRGPIPTNAHDIAVYKISGKRGEFHNFSYATLQEGGHLDAKQEGDKAFEGHYALDFNYVGGGFFASRMVCTWATTTLVWQCSGYM